MRVKRVGVEIPLMAGARPRSIVLQVYDKGELLHPLPLKLTHLPVHAPLLPEQAQLLARDKRRPGEHRPLRLQLGRCDRVPYTFYCAALPGTTPPEALDLALVLWLELYDPPFPYSLLFHYLGCEARTHPLTQVVHWPAHTQWTLAERLGHIQQVQQETPCGCGLCVRMHLLPYRPMVKARQPVYHLHWGRHLGHRPHRGR